MRKSPILKIISLIIFTILTSKSGFCQSNRTLSGSIADQNEPFIGAVVLVKQLNDSSLIKAGITDSTGSFELSFQSPDSILLEVSYLGYETYYNTIVLNSDSIYNIGSIELTESSVALNEVTVTAQRAFAEQKIDRIVINPDVLISNAGLTALELMERSPGLSVDMNGNISIKGKPGVMIFVDDKPTYLSGDDLANYLKTIPSSSIARIEIMSNPPAKYDAAGNAGIINIIMKKNVLKGWNGGINLSFGQGRYSRSNNSATLNYRVGKFNFFSSLSGNYNKSYQDLTIERNYFDNNGQPASSFVQKTYITPIGRNGNAKIGMDYYVNDKVTLGFSTGGLLTKSKRNLTNDATVTDGNQEVVSFVEADNPLQIQFNNFFVNGNANIILKDKSEFSVNLDFIRYNNNMYQILTNNILDSRRILQNTSILESDLPTQLTIRSAKIDYSKELSKGQLEAGLKSSFVSADNKAQFYDLIDDVREVNNEFSNSFLYDENINSAYVNYSIDLNKLSFQLGLRGENTNIKGNQLGNEVVSDSSFKSNYVSIFPTFYMQYRVDSLNKHVFGLSAGRRIERPDYKDLNPFSYPMDRFTYYGGNPFLVPTFSYNVDLSYTFNNFLTAELTFSRANNVISETNEQRGTIYYSRPGNFAKQTTYGVTVNGSHKITKWWTLQLYAALLNNKYVSPVYTEMLDDSKWYFVIAPVNQFFISKKWSAELSASYQSTVLVGQFLIQPIFNVRAGISTKILKEKGSLKLNVSDIFYTNQIEGSIRNISNANAGWFSYLDSRVVSLSFSYRFSKGQNLKSRQIGGSESEQNRVKS